jgi:hypothetical protein
LKEDYFTMRSDMMKEITFTGKMIVMDWQRTSLQGNHLDRKNNCY